MLESREYESVLYGIYISMTEANTYGCNLTFGLMDVLAQYYQKIRRAPCTHGFYKKIGK